MVRPEQWRPLGKLPGDVRQEADVSLEVGHRKVADGCARAGDGDGADGDVDLLGNRSSLSAELANYNDLESALESRLDFDYLAQQGSSSGQKMFDCSDLLFITCSRVALLDPALALHQVCSIVC